MLEDKEREFVNAGMTLFLDKINRTVKIMAGNVDSQERSGRRQRKCSTQTSKELEKSQRVPV